MIHFPACRKNKVTSFTHIETAHYPGQTALEVCQAGSRSNPLYFHQFPASSTQVGPVQLLSEQTPGPGSPRSPLTLEQAELKLHFQLLTFWFPWNSPASCGLLHSWAGSTPSSAPTAARFPKTGGLNLENEGFGSACQTEATAEDLDLWSPCNPVSPSSIQICVSSLWGEHHQPHSARAVGQKSQMHFQAIFLSDNHVKGMSCCKKQV